MNEVLDLIPIYKSRPVTPYRETWLAPKSFAATQQNFKSYYGNKYQERLDKLSQILNSSEFWKIDWENLFSKSEIPEKYHLFHELPIPDEENGSIYIKERKKWITQDFPKIFPTERDQTAFLTRTLLKSLEELEEKYPDHQNDPDALEEELGIWNYTFDETIRQVATHSKSLALILQNIKSRYQEIIESYDYQVGELDDIISAHSSSRHSVMEFDPNDTQVVKDLRAHITLLEKDMDKIRKENEKLSYEKFQLKEENNKAKDDVSKLIKVTDDLRQAVKDSEQKYYVLKFQNSAHAMNKSLGSVPDEVLIVWEQLSHFAKVILSGDLLRLDFDNYLPPDNIKTYEEPYFYMKKPPVHRTKEHNVHYLTFFDEIKEFGSESNINQIFLDLEKAIRQFINEFSSQYTSHYRESQNSHTQIMQQLQQQVLELRSTKMDDSAWIRTILSNPSFIKLPKKGDFIDVDTSINAVYQFCCKSMETSSKIRSASMAILQEFRGSSNPDLISFLAQVSCLSKKQINVDLFKRFILKDLPFHAFIFISDVKANLIKDPQKKRSSLLQSYFGQLGYMNLPTHQRSTYDSMFCTDDTKFLILCLGFYMYSIEKIELHVCRIPNDYIQTAAADMLSLTHTELVEVCDFMSCVAEKNEKPSSKEFAVLLFRKKMPFERLFYGFDFAQSEFYQYIATFGMSKKAKKSFIAQKTPLRQGSSEIRNSKAKTMPIKMKPTRTPVRNLNQTINIK